MQVQDNLVLWLDHLQQLEPPAGLMFVGAGNGSSKWLQQIKEWQTSGVTLIEADEDQFAYLEQSTNVLPDWKVRCQVVAERTDVVTYHQYSLSTESGLLPPESLKNIWPNIQQRDQQKRHAISLAELLADHPASWLWLDCLPALDLLRGAGEALNSVNLAIIRVTLKTELETDTQGLTSLQKFMKAKGMRQIYVEESRNPALGLALFVRDTQQVRGSYEQQITVLSGKLKAATEAAVEARQHATQLETQVDSLQQRQQSLVSQKDKLQRLLDNVETEAAKLRETLNDRTRENRTAQELQARLEEGHKQLQRVNAQLSAEMTRAQAQIDLMQSMQPSDIHLL